MKKQKTGVYRTKVKIGVDADGHDIVKWIQGGSKAELEANRQKVIAYYIEGDGLKKDRLFGDYAVEWYHVRKEPFLSASSKNCYRTILNAHILPAFGDRNLRAIRAVELQEYLNRFAGKSKSQITLVSTVLKGIFASARQDGLIRNDPAGYLRRPQATPPREKRALTPDERARMERLFPTHPYGIYLAVLYYTGMRPGEVRGLRWGDIDWKTGLIHVQRDIDYAGGASVGDLKTPAANRYIPVTQPLRELLYPRRQAAGAFLFPGADGKPLAQVTAQRMWIRLMADCGLADPILPEESTCYLSGDIRGQYRPRITPHVMRHNFITMCWESGMDLLITMKIVGHSDYETTRKIYTHLSDRHLASARLQLDHVFDPERDARATAPQANDPPDLRLAEIRLLPEIDDSKAVTSSAI